MLLSLLAEDFLLPPPEMVSILELCHLTPSLTTTLPVARSRTRTEPLDLLYASPSMMHILPRGASLCFGLRSFM